MFTKTQGHQKQKDLFERLITAGKLGHGYVFTGPANIGKTTFALELAEGLTGGSVLDLFLADHEEGMDIEEGRRMQHFLALSPTHQRKVAIVTYAERLSGPAANSLLKVLEEPPASSLIILTVSNYHALLPTVASRLQRISFAAMPDQEIYEALIASGYSQEVGSKVVPLCFGRLGLAKTLASHEDFLAQIEQAREAYQVLTEGDQVTRLQMSAKLAEMESLQISQLLKYNMQIWIHASANPGMGARLLTAFSDLGANLNTKLVMDNLFLSETT